MGLGNRTMTQAFQTERVAWAKGRRVGRQVKAWCSGQVPGAGVSEAGRGRC